MDADDDMNDLCTKLGIEEKIINSAREILDDLILKCPEEFGCRSRSAWITCLVYTVSVDSRFPYGLSDPHLPDTDNKPQINLTLLLQAAEIDVKTFFQLMSVVKEYCFLSDAVLQTVRKLEKNYCVLTVLFSKLDKILASVLTRPEKTSTLSEKLQLAEYQKRKDLCWSIFLVSRVNLIPSEQELCTAFTILLCCVMVVIIDSPPFLLHPPYDELDQESEDEEIRRRVLRSLCEQFGANLVEVEQVYEHYWKEFEASVPTEAGDYVVEKLHETYLSSFEVDSDVNALLFLEYDRLIYPDDLWSEVRLRDKAPTTPVSSVLSSVQTLDHIINYLHDTPSQTLIHYCRQCVDDPWPSIEHRLAEVEVTYMNEYRSSVGVENDTVCVQRYRSARKLYYHILELLLKMEEEKLGHSDFSKLLNHDTFHRALLALSVEIVLVSYRLAYNPLTGSPHAHTSCLSFPWVLRVTKISAYDLYKVIESFIRAEPRLTKDVVKHLQLIENEILDSIAWKEGSPLFDAIERAEGQHLPSVLTAASPAKHTPTHVSAQEMFSSPRPVRTCSQTHDDQVHEPQAPRSTSLNLFYNKVSRLAYYRLTLLGEKLDIDKDQLRRIWTCLQYCITHKPGLIRGRHLDQVMLCSVYAVCKICNLDIKFKTIVSAYRRMDNTSPMIYKAVLINSGLYDSIIGFYNDVFLEPMKKVIMDFSPQSPTPQLSPVPSVRQPANVNTSPSYRVAKRNFYVSPLKSSPFKVPLTPSKMTPRMRRLYSFGEQSGSSMVLRSINDSMHQLKRLKFHDAKARQPRSLKRLKFDNDPETDTVATSDSQQPVLFSQRLAQTRASPSVLDED